MPPDFFTPERKKIRYKQAILLKNRTKIQLNQIQLTSQTTNHVEITKILSTSQ